MSGVIRIIKRGKTPEAWERFDAVIKAAKAFVRDQGRPHEIRARTVLRDAVKELETAKKVER